MRINLNKIKIRIRLGEKLIKIQINLIKKMTIFKLKVLKY
jgi:hypothetical protein